MSYENNNVRAGANGPAFILGMLKSWGGSK